MVDLLYQISKTGIGFGTKKYLKKPISSMIKKTNKLYNKPIEYHSKMADGRKVYYGIDDFDYEMHIIVNQNDAVEAILATEKKWKSQRVESVISIHRAKIHKLYYHLIMKFDYIIITDRQSIGGVRVWQKLSKMKNINIYGINPQTDQSYNIDLREIHETHVSDIDLLKIKSASTGVCKKIVKNEIGSMKETRMMNLVAHSKTSTI
jgi:hypothetical protein